MFYKKSVNEVLRELDSSEKGLGKEEAENRLSKYGYNEIKKEAKFKKLKSFANQFKDPIVIILIIAVGISFILQHMLDAIVIAAILILNAALGFFQEFKVEKAITLLKKLSAFKSRVIRDGKIMFINSAELVPGDILLVESGDRVGADARLIKAINLEMDESNLTGESVGVVKQIEKLKLDLPIAERSNMIFSSSIVNNGNGIAIVTSTGMNTEIGKVAELVEEIEEEETPLQKKLKKLGITLGLAALAVVFGIFLIGILKGLEFFEMFLTALSLAVAAIPEGLPAVVTITLALGVRRMIKKNALIRKLRAIETLGSVSIICSDKTGTLTTNEMMVNELFVNNQNIKVSGEGYKEEGEFYFNEKRLEQKEIEKLKLLLEISANCNNASLPNIGDPTEIALLVMAKKGGVVKNFDRVDEISFSSERKYMVSVHENDKNIISFVKGAPEKILELSKYINQSGKVRRLTSRDRKVILKENERMAGNALRVLGIAYKENKNSNEAKKVSELVFVGLTGMSDPPRKEVKKAIKIAKEAGIRSIMITGDHRLTARAIANKIGISGEILDGNDLNNISDEELKEVIDRVGVFARVDPAHKVRILRVLQENGEVVAMTGDGVNDAPALKKADVGIAMAIKGTDVARSASDMVLVDDNYASIVRAVREGRVIYDNIRKFIRFLLAANFGEILLIFFGILIGLPLVLLPLQILWINLITDSLPALSLGAEKSEAMVMKKKPRNPKEHILHGTFGFILLAGIAGFIVSGLLFLLEFNSTGNIDKARTFAMAGVIMFEMFFVYSCRTEGSAFRIGLFSNKALNYSVLISISLLLAVIYTPLNSIFGLVFLSLIDWVKIILFSSAGFWFFEVWKVLKNFKRKEF